jgi:DinB superfamily
MLGDMSEDARSPAQYASDIDAARERLVAFASGCSDEQWKAAPLDGDPRAVGVVVDHVAHAYEYLAGWMRQILDGQPVTVDGEVVDALNAEHAARAADVTRAEAVEHLRRSGAAISQLVAGCSAGDLQADEGRVERLVQIAIRHADGHRAEIEAGLAVWSGPGPG